MAAHLGSLIDAAGGEPIEAARYLINQALRQYDDRAEVGIDTSGGRRRMLGPGRRIVVTRYTGRAPTLHQMRIQSEVDLPNASSPRATAIALIDTMSPQICYQALRQEDTRRLGLGEFPLYVGSEAMHIEHLYIDRSLVEMSRETATNASQRIEYAISAITSQPTSAYRGGPRMETKHGFLCEAPRPDNTRVPMRTVGFRMHYGKNGMEESYSTTSRATWDGETLRLFDQAIPESALAALPGRSVGDLVRVHEELDDRAIVSARMESQGDRDMVVVTLEPDPMPAFMLEKPRQYPVTAVTGGWGHA